MLNNSKFILRGWVRKAKISTDKKMVKEIEYALFYQGFSRI